MLGLEKKKSFRGGFEATNMQPVSSYVGNFNVNKAVWQHIVSPVSGGWIRKTRLWAMQRQGIRNLDD
ncbi:unnamed protein product [Fusarium graminearum]|nr:unnamed protein product [Fusarium graminearum]